MTLVHPVSETVLVTGDGLLVEGEDMGAAKLQGEKGVQWLPKGCLAKPRLSGSVLAKARLVAAATHLRCAAVSVGRVSDLSA